MGKTYQMHVGKPFVLRDIDRLFYACNYMNSNKSFLMEKEKFEQFLQRGMIQEVRTVSGF